VGPGADDHQVPVARGDERTASDDPVVVARLAHIDAAVVVESRGKGSGESRRHMLHHGNPWRIGRQGREDPADGLGASGGGTDSDELVSGHPQGRVHGALGRAHRRLCAVGPAARRTASPHPRLCGCPDGVDVCLGLLLQEAAHVQLWFGDDVDRTGFQGAHGGLGVWTS
jgi:hypothetical protein